MSMVSRLKNIIKQQNKMLHNLQEVTDQLNAVKEKSKSPQVRDAIDAAVEAAELLGPNKHSLHSAFYEVEKETIRITSEAKPVIFAYEHNAANTTKHEAILKVCEELKVSVAKQQEDINMLMRSQTSPHPTYASKARAQQPTAPILQQHNIREAQPQRSSQAENENPTASEWQTVKNPRRANRGPRKKRTENKKKRTKPPLSDAIAVKPGEGKSAAEILKAIKQDVEIDTIGAQVSTITESRGGEIIIKLTSKDSKRAAFEEELRNKLGSRAAVRGLVQFEDIEIQDLDSVTTDTEVETCVRQALGTNAEDQCVQVKSLRQSFRGIQRATVRVKSIDAQKLEKIGRIKIGWVHARVKIKIRAIKCFRCLGYGHRKHSCTGTDRSEACCLCTDKGHKASSCKSPPKCAACQDLNEQTDHYPGSGKCTAYRRAMASNVTNTQANERRGSNTDGVTQTHTSNA